MKTKPNITEPSNSLCLSRVTQACWLLCLQHSFVVCASFLVHRNLSSCGLSCIFKKKKILSFILCVL
jgi:hypothetical protein